MADGDLRQALAELELSQRDLARLLGRSPQGVNKWMSDGVPGYVWAFLAAYRMLNDAQRAVLRANLLSK